MKKLGRIFPNARITNIYASTEMGTVLASDGDVFTPKANTAGLLKIVNGELWIHQSLAGSSEDIIPSGEWYNTGDCVEVISEEPLSFKFTSRKNEIINVGGYNVNPNEVEQALQEIDGIRAARVFAKKNSILGKYCMRGSRPVGRGSGRSLHKSVALKTPATVQNTENNKVCRRVKIYKKRENFPENHEKFLITGISRGWDARLRGKSCSTATPSTESAALCRTKPRNSHGISPKG